MRRLGPDGGGAPAAAQDTASCDGNSTLSYQNDKGAPREGKGVISGATGTWGRLLEGEIDKVRAARRVRKQAPARPARRPAFSACAPG